MARRLLRGPKAPKSKIKRKRAGRRVKRRKARNLKLFPKRS